MGVAACVGVRVLAEWLSRCWRGVWVRGCVGVWLCVGMFLFSLNFEFLIF